MIGLGIVLILVGIGLAVFAPWFIIWGLLTDHGLPVVGITVGITAAIACAVLGVTLVVAVARNV